ncbi:MAG: hypothetical protein ACR2GH_19095, partial [Pseudonocardia sp.]
PRHATPNTPDHIEPTHTRPTSLNVTAAGSPRQRPKPLISLALEQFPPQQAAYAVAGPFRPLDTTVAGRDSGNGHR